jgi:tRNA modification GTPase
MIRLLAAVEVELNYPDEVETDYSSLRGELLDLRNEIAHFVNSSENGIILSRGIKTAIVGETNVGKSTLLNALLKRDRAIVSDLPGTTRDTIEEDLNIEGVLFNVVDTAGIREATDAWKSWESKGACRQSRKPFYNLLRDPHTRITGIRGRSSNMKVSDLLCAANKSIFERSRAALTGNYKRENGEGMRDLEKLMLKKTDDITSIEDSVFISASRNRSFQDSVLTALTNR